MDANKRWYAAGNSRPQTGAAGQSGLQRHAERKPWGTRGCFLINVPLATLEAADDDAIVQRVALVASLVHHARQVAVDLARLDRRAVVGAFVADAKACVVAVVVRVRVQLDEWAMASVRRIGRVWRGGGRV